MVLAERTQIPGDSCSTQVEIPNPPASRSPFSSCPVSTLLPAHRPGSQPGGVLAAAFELCMNVNSCVLLWLDIASVTGILIAACRRHAAEQSPPVGHVLGAEYSICSKGYIAQDCFISAKKNRRMKDSMWFSLSKFPMWRAPCACKLW